ncbi:hypothetical protein [Chamaesiphon sp.]|uniref:hypothetical protein n=1 Tax=Chamaesiphon sp. TaxID=2814140 RepID=UPI00359460BA
MGGTAQLEFREQKAGTEGQLSAERTALQASKEQQAILKKSKSPDQQAISQTQAAIEQQYNEISELFDKAAIAGGHFKNTNAQPLSGQGWEIAIELK